MIRLFERTETNYNHNKTILSPLYCFIEEESNGMFELELELPQIISVNKGDLIKAPTPRSEQLFRVYRIKKTLKNKIIYARHIYYDLSKNFIIDVNINNQSCFTALQSILDNAETTHSFIGTSNILNTSTVNYARMNPIQAIMNSDNGILTLYNGKLVRNNFNINIKADGLDRGYEIRVGKNLVGIEDDTDESNVKTRIYPTVELDGSIIALPEKYVDSPLINNYGDPIIYEERIALTDEQKALAIEDIYIIMRNHCEELFSKYNVDKPIINYKIDFVELSKTEQYRDFAILEQLDLYDIVSCYIPNLDINIKATVIKYKYDCLKNRYESIELGDFKSSSNYKTEGIVKQLQSKIQEQSQATQSAIDYATQTITGNKGGYLITRTYPNGKPYELLVMDTDDINTAVNVIRLNNSGLGFSQNGYNGPFGTAITIDSHINASYIDVGELTSIILKSSNYVPNVSGTKINLADGTIDSKQYKVSSDGSMTCENATLTGGLIKSSNYVANSTGMSINLSNGVIDSKNFKVDSAGNLTAQNGNFSGNVTASNITGSTLELEYNYGGTLMKTSIVDGRVDTNLINMLDFNGNIISSLSAGGMYFANDNYYDSNGVKTGNIICSDVNAVDIDCTSISINGSVPITALNKNDYTYPPSSHTHNQLNGGFTPVTLYSNTFRPESDDVLMNGSPSYRWSTVYASTSTISTSDRNQKHDITNLDDVYRQIILKLRPVKFKYNNGSSNRWHTGFISNDVEILLEELGLSSYDFAAFIKSPIYEIIDEETGEYDTSSAIVGYLYGLRYEEFISPTISLVQEQDKKINELEQRLLKLEVA